MAVDWVREDTFLRSEAVYYLDNYLPRSAKLLHLHVAEWNDTFPFVTRKKVIALFDRAIAALPPDNANDITTATRNPSPGR